MELTAVLKVRKAEFLDYRNLDFRFEFSICISDLILRSMDFGLSFCFWTWHFTT